MTAWLSRISLVFILAVASILELLLNRIGVHAASPAARAHSSLFGVVDTLAIFFFYFTGITALIVFAWGLVVLIADRRIFGVASRIALMLAGAAFLPLAGTGLFVPLPAKLAPYLNIAFALMVVVLVVAVMPRRASLRHKLGLLYLVAPLLLHCYWLATKQFVGIGPAGTNADIPARLLEVGQHLVVVGAFACFLFFAPTPRWPRAVGAVPLSVAVVLSVAAAFFVGWHYPLAAKAAYWGLGIHLPTPMAGEAFHLALHISGLFFFALAVAALFMAGPIERAMALGLLLIGVSGYQLELPYQLLLTLAGMMQLVRSSLAMQSAADDHAEGAVAGAAQISSAQWRAFLRRAAEDVGASDVEPVVLQGESGRIARARGLKGSTPITIRLLLREARIAELEVDIGQPPQEPAPASLYRRRARRGHRVADGRATKVEFDADFVLRDSVGGVADAIAPLIDPLKDALHGAVGIWPAEGLRYVMRPLPDGWPVPLAELSDGVESASIEDLSELVSLLVALAEGLEIR